MFEIGYKNRITALVTAALLMATALMVMLVPLQADDSADYTNKGFTINMRVGDTFSYTPRSNLDDTRFSWVITPYELGNNENVLTYNKNPEIQGNATITYTPEEVGDATFFLNAVWQKDGLRQTATQTIHVIVLDRIAVTNTENFTDTVNISANSAENNILRTYTLTGGDGRATYSEPVVFTDYNDNTGEGTPSEGIINATIDGYDLIISNTSNPEPGTYTVVAEASYSYDGCYNGDVSSTTAYESKTIIITVNVGDGLNLANTSSSAVIGQIGEDIINQSYRSGNPFTISVINSNNVTDLTIQKGQLDVNLSEGWVSTENRSAYHEGVDVTQDDETANQAEITLPTNGWSSEAINGQSAKLVFDIDLDGNDLEGNAINTVSVPYTLTLYASLAFITTPVNEEVNIHASSSNGLEVLLTATVIGARTIMYDWGDGTPATPVAITSTTSTFVSANHTYAQPGTYFVRITASNDVGDSVFITPYTTGTNFTLDDDQSIDAGKIDATVDGDTVTLSGNPTVTGAGEHSEIEFTWSYRAPGMGGPQVITPSDKPGFVRSVGSALILDKGQISSGTVFFLSVSTQFEGSSEPLVSEASSYTYVSGDFFEEHGWLFVIFLVIFILGLIAIFYFGYQILPAYVFTIVSAILAVILFFHKDFGGLF